MRTNRRSSNLLKQIKRCMAFLLIIVGINYGAFASKTTCEEGEYLPKGGDEEGDCVQCPAKIGKFVCEKKKHDDGEAKNADQYSLKVCNKNEKVNSDRKCEKVADSKLLNCKPGEALVQGSSCTKCTVDELTYRLTNMQKKFNDAKGNSKKMWEWVKKYYEDNKSNAGLGAAVNHEIHAINFLLEADSSNIKQWVCGGVNDFGQGNDFIYGVVRCPDGQIANADFSDCIKPAADTRVECRSDEYLPAGEIKCKDCPNVLGPGVACGGGEHIFYGPSTKDQGMETCVKGQDIIKGDNVHGTWCAKCETGAKDDFSECKPLDENSALGTEVKNFVGKKWTCNSGYYLVTKEYFMNTVKNAIEDAQDWRHLTPCKDGYNGAQTSKYKFEKITDRTLTSSEQGKVECPSDQFSNRSDPTKCVETKYECKKGEYLPAGETTCALCTDAKARNWAANVWCKGGSFPKSDKIQGTDTCKSGQVANEKRDGCIDKECGPGQYYNDTKCVSCKDGGQFEKDARENKMYCPGTKRGKSSDKYDYLETCPTPMLSKPNEELSGCECSFGGTMGNCNNKLDKKYLKYGPAGNENLPLAKHCWTKMDDKDYKKCMGL